MSEYASAIDDSFRAVPWPKQPTSQHDDEHTGYNGRREGTWEVSSSVGSYIDDRCPTVHGYPNARGGEGHVSPIDEGLAQRLAKAVVEQKRAAAENHVQENATKEPPRTSCHEKQSPPTQEEVRVKPKAKPFVIPLLREQITEPEKPDARRRGKQKVADNTAEVEPARHKEIAHTPPELQKSNRASDSPILPRSKPASTISSQSSAGTRLVRIAGKSGEEAFVKLPMMLACRDGSSLASKQAPVLAEDIAPKFQKPAPPLQKETKKQKKATKKKNKQDRDGQAVNLPEAAPAHKKPVHSPIQEAETAEFRTKITSRVSKRDIAAENVLVSLPGMPKRAPTPASPRASLAKDSGIFMDFTSKKSLGKGSRNITPEMVSLAHKISKLSSASDQLSVGSRLSRNSLQKGRFYSPAIGSLKKQDFAEHQTRQSTSPTPSIGPPSIHASVAESSSTRQAESEHGSNSTRERLRYRSPSVHSERSFSSVEHQFDRSTQSRDFVVEQGNAITPEQSVYSDAVLSSKHGFSTPSSELNISEHQRAQGHQRQSAVSSVASHRYVAPTPRQFPSPAASGSRRSSESTRSHFPVSRTWKDNSNHTASGLRGDGFAPTGDTDPPPSVHHAPSVREDPRTNFAGQGWISPHPLSVAPSEAGASPESVIHLPGEGFGSGGFLTYEDWKARREEIATVAGSNLYAESRASGGAEFRVASLARSDSTSQQHFGNTQRSASTASHQHTETPSQRFASHYSTPGPAPQFHEPRRSVSQASGPQYHPLSIHTHITARSRGSFAISNREPAIAGSNEGSALPKADGYASQSGVYNVGMTPAELESYQHRLRDTVSRLSAQLSAVQAMQSPRQPDYTAWDRQQSHSPKVPSPQNWPLWSPSKPDFPREHVQLWMPWDKPQSSAGPRSGHSSQSHHMSRSSPSSMSAQSGQSTNRPTSARMTESPRTSFPVQVAMQQRGSPALPVAAPPQISNRPSGVSSYHKSLGHGAEKSRSLSVRSGSTLVVPPSESEATYGSGAWQNLEDTEEGKGGFNSYGGW